MNFSKGKESRNTSIYDYGRTLAKPPGWKSKQGKEINRDADGSVNLQHKNTDLEDKQQDSSSIGSYSSQPASSQSYWDGSEDISDCINSAHLDELESMGVLAGSAESASSKTTLLSNSIPGQSSLGKRKSSDLSDGAESPRPRKFQRIATDTVRHSVEKPYFIADTAPLLGYFKSFNLSRGVTFEIARLASIRRSLPEITIETLQSLQGSNAKSAPKAINVILGKGGDDTNDIKALKDAFAKEMLAKAPWEELDKEEEALRCDPYAGLGFNKDFPQWYGGKVRFGGRLKDISTTKTPEYIIILDQPTLGPSSRFLRRFGASSFLRIKIPKSIINKSNNDLMEFFIRPFVMNGEVFRSFYAKDHTVFLFRTNEIAIGTTVTIPVNSFNPSALSLMDFLNWHNPLECNFRQAMTKWASRFALGLSTSVPGLRLDPADIIEEPDIISSDKSEMTDGCGLINKVALLSLRVKYDWRTSPTAIQCRVGGAKGLLCLHPDDAENRKERPCVWVRPSQTKIKYIYPSGVEPDLAMLSIDVLQSSHMRSPARLSAETIINLSDRGVPQHIFVKLLRDGLEEQVASLTNWDGPKSMFNLWCAVSRVGGVIPARMAREASGEAKARGYRLRETEDIEPDDEDGLAEPDATHQRSTAWWADDISGCPSSIEETVLVMLDSGFTPQSSPVLRDKLNAVIKKMIDNYVLRYRLDVPKSCSAFIVPDPYGVLGPDEIQIKSSHRDFKTPDGLDTDIITGDVLITRNPCKLPTDVQKVRAVQKTELSDFVDVIVCPVTSSRRFAELLAGGDYDGDKGVVFYDPDIVNSFQNADEKYSYEPEGLPESFSQNTEKVVDVLERIKEDSPMSQVQQIQKFLLGAIRDTSMVGKYSSYHDHAIYTLGYNHPETIRLSYMFCSVLDAPKTGRVVLPEVVQLDTKKYQRRPPKWKETKEEADRLQQQTSNEAHPARPSFLGTFIMDIMQHQARKEGDAQRAKIQHLFPTTGRIAPDPDLTQPWIEAERIAARWKAEHKICLQEIHLDIIRTHVHRVFDEHKARMKRAVEEKGKTKQKGNEKRCAFTDLPIEVRQDVLRASAKDFVSKPLPDEVFMQEEDISKLRASYAYLYDSMQHEKGTGWSRFPFDVAMRELCAIKARAVGRTKTVTEDFYARFYMKQLSSKKS